MGQLGTSCGFTRPSRKKKYILCCQDTLGPLSSAPYNNVKFFIMLIMLEIKNSTTEMNGTGKKNSD
jgi:hypothetical protein